MTAKRINTLLTGTAALILILFLASPAAVDAAPHDPTLQQLRARLAHLTRPAVCATRRAHAIRVANATLSSALACASRAASPSCTGVPAVPEARIKLSVARGAGCAPLAPRARVEDALRAFERAANDRAHKLGLRPAYDTLVLEPMGDAPHVACLSLHGLNGTAGDQASGAGGAMMAGALPSRVRVYVPQAKKRPVTFYGGARLTAWFDMKSDSPAGPWASGQINEAVHNVASILDADARMFGSDRWLAATTGFSLGAALSASVSLTRRVSAVSMLSGFVPDPQSFPRPGGALSAASPVLVVHGGADQIVNVDIARMSVRVLRGLGRNVTYDELPGMPHSLGERQTDSILRAYDWIGRAMIPGRDGDWLVAPPPLVWTLRASSK